MIDAVRAWVTEMNAQVADGVVAAEQLELDQAETMLRAVEDRIGEVIDALTGSLPPADARRADDGLNAALSELVDGLSELAECVFNSREGNDRWIQLMIVEGRLSAEDHRYDDPVGESVAEIVAQWRARPAA